MTCFERNNNQLELTVADDGRGIDAAAVARRAGKPTPTTSDGLLALLAIPGLSTVERPTTTSGRGLGVDIVQQVTVGELGGELVLETQVGVGTRFTLRLPLSITIQDAFSFRCGQQTFAVPVAMVDEVIELDPPRFSRRRPFGHPAAHLRSSSGAARRCRSSDLNALFPSIGAPPTCARRWWCARNGEPIGFEVDQVLGQQEVVVRPLDDPLVRVPGVVGGHRPRRRAADAGASISSRCRATLAARSRRRPRA